MQATAIAAPCNCEHAQRARQKAIDDALKARDYATACRNWAAGEVKTADEFSASLRAAGITARQYGTAEGTAAIYQQQPSAAWRKTLRALRAGRCRTPDEYRELLKAAGVRRSELKDAPYDSRTDAVQVSAAWRKQLGRCGRLPEDKDRPTWFFQRKETDGLVGALLENLQCAVAPLKVVNGGPGRRAASSIRRGQRAWSAIRATAEEQRTLWLEVGVALMYGKDKANRKAGRTFAQWVQKVGFGDIKPNTRSSAMWLAANWSTVTVDLDSELTHPENIRQAHRDLEAAQALPEDLHAVTPRAFLALPQRDAEKVGEGHPARPVEELPPKIGAMI